MYNLKKKKKPSTHLEVTAEANEARFGELLDRRSLGLKLLHGARQSLLEDPRRNGARDGAAERLARPTLHDDDRAVLAGQHVGVRSEQAELTQAVEGQIALGVGRDPGAELLDKVLTDSLGQTVQARGRAEQRAIAVQQLVQGEAQAAQRKSSDCTPIC
jgi:hypothetical protein